jgi:hypothetical protein
LHPRDDAAHRKTYKEDHMEKNITPKGGFYAGPI